MSELSDEQRKILDFTIQARERERRILTLARSIHERATLPSSERDPEREAEEDLQLEAELNSLWHGALFHGLTGYADGIRKWRRDMTQTFDYLWPQDIGRIADRQAAERTAPHPIAKSEKTRKPRIDKGVPREYGPDRPRINREMAEAFGEGRATMRDLAQRYNLSYSTVRRSIKAHQEASAHANDDEKRERNQDTT